MDKISKYNKEVRDGLSSGVNKLVDIVRSTLGAKGKLVGIFDSQEGLHVTKDGYTVAQSVRVDSNKLETIGIRLVNEAITNTNSVVGDSTTTTGILCQEMINRGFDKINKGANPLKLKEGLELGLDFARKSLEETSEPVEDKISEIATISGNNNKEIGKIIGEAFDAAGTHEESSIKVYDTTDDKTTVEIINGYKLAKGFLRDSFINHPSGTKCVYKNPLIVMVHATLTSFRDWIPLLEQVAQKQRPLVIIADKFEGEFLNSLEVSLQSQLNQLQRNGGNGYFQQIGVIQNPMGFSSAEELYSDMAIVTDCKSSHLSVMINDIKVDDLGEADEIVVNRTHTLIIGGKGKQEAIDAKIKKLRAQAEDDNDFTDFQKAVIRQRIESLSGTHATIRVGGQSPAEMKEAKDLYDDALNAVRAALKEGIVAGGGVTLLRIANDMRQVNTFKMDRDVRYGWEIFMRAIEEPFYRVMINASEDKNRIKRIVLNNGVYEKLFTSKGTIIENNCGYNVLTKEYVDMIHEGIIDPSMAERVAIENAVSVASLMYNMNGVVLEDIG